VHQAPDMDTAQTGGRRSREERGKVWWI